MHDISMFRKSLGAHTPSQNHAHGRFAVMYNIPQMTRLYPL
jgi:hypothetical protein